MAKALILVIDDDVSIVNLLKENLESEGYAVMSAYDGQSALELASARRPNLVVIDMNMPGLSGLDTVTLLRAQDATRVIPVILLTGESARAVPSQMKERFRGTRTRGLEIDAGEFSANDRFTGRRRGKQVQFQIARDGFAHANAANGIALSVEAW